MRTPIKDLSCDAVETKPIDRDWSEGYAESWDYHESAECQECGAVVCNVRGETRHNDVDDESECTGYLNASGPMMNYYYPLPSSFPRDGDIDDAQRAIAHLPLCIVSFHDGESYALALTGGGMNLSWQICEAFMRLGYLPPLHYCHLPDMAGTKLNAHVRWILAGCRASARTAAQWARNVTRDLLRLAEQLKEDA